MDLADVIKKCKVGEVFDNMLAVPLTFSNPRAEYELIGGK